MNAAAAALFVGLLIALAIFALFLAAYRFVPRRDPVSERLAEYSQRELPKQDDEAAGTRRPGPKWLARGLARADLPLAPNEYLLIILGMGVLGVLLGTLRLNFAAGLLLGGLFAYLPIFYLRMAEGRRKRAFGAQLPDVLTLLTGSLRAGYGLNQAMELLVEQMPPPAAREFGRVVTATSLGIPLPRALEEMARRVGSDDLDLVVMAISVQQEMGGNLAHILETIGHTVRERVRILREVQVLTAQQRMTGYVLAALPIFLSVALSLMRPGYFEPFFEPGLIRLIPMAGITLMVIGFFLIQRVVDINV
jgi:tight adherence protein B